jgi:hypothetical protein
MKRTLLVALVAVFAGTAAWAIKTKLITYESPHRFLRAVEVFGVTTAAGGLSASTLTVGDVPVSFIEGTKDFDFPSTSTNCVDSSTADAVGAAVGNRCVLGLSAEAFATTAATYSCYVSNANVVKVRFCAFGSSVNPADAGFNFTVLKH